jgi:hypothetical protein
MEVGTSLGYKDTDLRDFVDEQVKQYNARCDRETQEHM